MEISLVSGGVDSTLGFHLFCRNSLPVHISYCSEYQLEEFIACSNIYRNKLKNISILNQAIKKSDIFIPAKSITLASVCVSFIPCVSKINIFELHDDNYIGKNEYAYQKISEVLSICSGTNIIVCSPTQCFTKSELITQAKTKIPDIFNFLKTNIFSCYTPIDMRHCNNCNACLRREILYFNAGVESKEILSDEIISLYVKRDDISPERKESIKKYANERKGLQV